MAALRAQYAALAALLVGCSSGPKNPSEPPPPPPSVSVAESAEARPLDAGPAEPLEPSDAVWLKRREKELAEVINQNVGNMHGVRGVNGYTIEALDRAVTPRDMPVLERLLESDDSVYSRAAADVLSRKGPEGIAALRRAAERVKGNLHKQTVIEEALREVDHPRGPVMQALLSCQDGDMDACHTLGEIYETGKGVTANRGTARSFYEQACKGGRKPDCADAARLR